MVSGGAYLRYNASTASGNLRFRYYKSSSYSSQKAIQLYKLETSGGTVEPEEPETPTEPETPSYEYPEAGSTLTLDKAIEVANTKDNDTYTDNKYVITGTVKEVYNETYGNMYVTDGTNTITVYGTWNKDGSARYDAMEEKPVAGDKIGRASCRERVCLSV